MPRAGRQPLGLLRLSSAGQGRAQGLFGQHAVKGRVRRQRPCLWQPPPWRGAARSGAAHRAPSSAAFDAREQPAGIVAAQVRPHHRQRLRATGLGQPASQTLQPEWPQPGLGERYNIHPHAQRLALPSGGAGPVRAQGRGLGDGADHACRTGVRSAATGHRAAPTCARTHRPFRQGQPGRIQPVVATRGCWTDFKYSFMVSAGVFQPSVFRGLY